MEYLQDTGIEKECAEMQNNVEQVQTEIGYWASKVDPYEDRCDIDKFIIYLLK